MALITQVSGSAVGRLGPQGPRSHGTQPATAGPSSSFMGLCPGRAAEGRGSGAGWGPAGIPQKEGKLRSLGAKDW